MLRIFLPLKKTKPKELYMADKLNMIIGDSFASVFFISSSGACVWEVEFGEVIRKLCKFRMRPQCWRLST